MNLQHVHVPERLPGEDMAAYRARRNWSHLFADTRRTITPLPMQHRVDAQRRAKRQVVRKIGVRQWKKRLRVLMGKQS